MQACRHVNRRCVAPAFDCRVNHRHRFIVPADVYTTGYRLAISRDDLRNHSFRDNLQAFGAVQRTVEVADYPFGGVSGERLRTSHKLASTRYDRYFAIESNVTAFSRLTQTVQTVNHSATSAGLDSFSISTVTA